MSDNALEVKFRYFRQKYECFIFLSIIQKVKKALKLERQIMLRLEREITPKLGHLSLKEKRGPGSETFLLSTNKPENPARSDAF